MHIASLATHLDLIDTIARWHQEQWREASFRAEQVLCRANQDRIPTTYVAIHGAKLYGTALLVTRDMSTHREISPWLGGVFVAPAHRRKGIASALVRHAVRQAAAMGVMRLYLFTNPRDLYEKLGWRAIVEEQYEGQSVTIMAIDISA